MHCIIFHYGFCHWTFSMQYRYLLLYLASCYAHLVLCYASHAFYSIHHVSWLLVYEVLHVWLCCYRDVCLNWRQCSKSKYKNNIVNIFLSIFVWRNIAITWYKQIWKRPTKFTLIAKKGGYLFCQTFVHWSFAMVAFLTPPTLLR